MSATVTFTAGRRENRGAILKRGSASFADIAAQLANAKPACGKLPLAEYLEARRRSKDEALPAAERKAAKARVDSEKSVAGWYVLAEFDGDKRDADHFKNTSAATLDFDAGTLNEEAIRRALAGLNYVATTTYSHSPAKQRWRIHVSLSALVTNREQYGAVVDAIHARFGKEHPMDSRSRFPEQFWWRPACPPDAVQHHRVILHIEGRPFDVAAVQARAVEPPPAVVTAPPATGASLEDMRALLWLIDAPDRETWVNCLMAVHHETGGSAEGLELVDEWSRERAGGVYDAADVQEQWKSFKTSKKKPRTIGTLRHYAFKQRPVEFGERFPRASASDFAATTTTNEQRPGPEQQAEGEKIRDAALFRLNERYAQVKIGGQVFVMEERDGSERLSETDAIIEYQPREHFCQWHRGQTIASMDGKKQIDIAEEWLRWPNRRRYERIVFLPGRDTPKGAFNLWRGFTVEPKPGDWTRFKSHILENLCAGDDELYAYVLNWMSHAVQHPGSPSEVALVLRGERGTGKGKFARTFGALFGPHFYHASRPDHIVGPFNAHLEHTALLFADEAFFAGDKAHEAELKRLITEPTLAVEQKFMPRRMVQNNLHIIMASNEEWVVPAGMDERRFAVLNVGNAHREDHRYFQAIDQEMLVEGGLAAMLDELLRRDLSGFQPRQAPQTAGLTEQKLLSLGTADAWLYECLDGAEIRGEGVYFGQEWSSATALNVEKNRLWKSFDDWQGKHRYRRRVGVAQFWKRMRDVFGDQENRPRIADSDLRGERCFALPALTAARAMFAKKIGGRPEWAKEPRLLELM